MKHLLFAALLIFLTSHGMAQKNNFRDSLDNRLDVSDYLIHMHGFIPLAAIITEPALGNFGIAVAPIFISPQKNKGNKDRFHFPDITAPFAFYTANNSWGTGLFRMGSFPKPGLRYRVGALYGSVNLNFYRTVKDETFELGLNSKLTGALLEVSKSVYRNRIFVGLNYSYLNTSFSFQNPSDALPGVLDDAEFESKMSSVGLISEIDFRNSIFTPDKGVWFKVSFVTNDKFTGSDYSFNRLNLVFNAFIQPTRYWVSGFRVEGSAINDGAPFFSYPFINLRGIPVMRYQGSRTLVLETEQRFDFDRRWSMVAFAGAGYAVDKIKDATSEGWQWAGGTGFRYLVARMFRLRAGVDLAVSKENVAYYIVFGHNWNR